VRQFFLSLCVVSASIIGVAKAQNAKALQQAVNAANNADWASVTELRPKLDTQTARDVIDWMRLRGRQGSFS
jgi:soluble lytic murein transglycosylase